MLKCRKPSRRGPRKTPVLKGFDNGMGANAGIFGWIYIPVHYLVLPLLLGLFSEYMDISAAALNIAYIGISAAIVFTVFLPYLHCHYYRLAENLKRCILALLIGFAIEYALSIPTALLLMALEDNAMNPNNEAIMSMIADSSAIQGLTIFIAPVVEEVFFRGVIFGSIQRRSRAAAYIVSAALFSLMHVWQYALAYGDPGLLIYAIQYIPMSIALAWSYDRSRCIWTPIFFHMISNALSVYVLSLI